MGFCCASDGHHNALLKTPPALAVVEILEAHDTYIATNFQH